MPAISDFISEIRKIPMRLKTLRKRKEFHRQKIVEIEAEERKLQETLQDASVQAGLDAVIDGRKER